MTPSTVPIAIMARQPMAGSTKTRLVPAVGAAGAAALAEAFLHDVVDCVRDVPGAHPVLAVAPGFDRVWFLRSFPMIEILAQRGADLSARLAGVTADLLTSHTGPMMAINSDSPTLPPKHLEVGVAALSAGAEVVFGPTEDGGYYAVGMSEPLPALFREVAMSTRTTLADSVGIAEANDRAVTMLPPWFDVDEPKDLERLVTDLRHSPGAARHTEAALKTLGLA